MSKTKMYRVWSDMRNRCTCETNNYYPDYGGRGIVVCERWRKFENFFEDMAHSFKKGLELGRINNDLGYSKDNCRWETRKEQLNNTRRSRFVTYAGERMTVKQLSEKYGIEYAPFLGRIKRGWDIKRALSEPIKKRG